MLQDQQFTSEENHEYALRWITDAFMIHQTAKHRRPVYRHRYGDINLTSLALSSLLENSLAQVGKTIEQRAAQFIEFIDWERWERERLNQSGYLYSMGASPTLTETGIAWINCQLDLFGDMIQELGTESALKLMNIEVVA
jgi:hypothetical protein